MMNMGDATEGKTVELPQERIDAAIAFMKVAAKLIIEDE